MLVLPIWGWGQGIDTSGTNDGEGGEGSKASYIYDGKVIKQGNVPKPLPGFSHLPKPNPHCSPSLSKSKKITQNEVFLAQK